MHCNHTPLLPNFPRRFGRPRKTAVQKAKEQVSKELMRELHEFRSLFSTWIDLSPLDEGPVGE